ncbi:unnamed protein product, partial [Callosobruchus maculatus]
FSLWFSCLEKLLQIQRDRF